MNLFNFLLWSGAYITSHITPFTQVSKRTTVFPSIHLRSCLKSENLLSKTAHDRNACTSHTLQSHHIPVRTYIICLYVWRMYACTYACIHKYRSMQTNLHEMHGDIANGGTLVYMCVLLPVFFCCLYPCLCTSIFPLLNVMCISSGARWFVLLEPNPECRSLLLWTQQGLLAASFSIHASLQLCFIQ